MDSSAKEQFALFGPFCCDTKRRVVMRNGEIVPLAPKDLEILLTFLFRSGRIVEKKEIMEAVWPDTYVEEANLSRHVFNLRKSLGQEGESLIETIPKRGYRFMLPVTFNSVCEAPKSLPLPLNGQNAPGSIHLGQATPAAHRWRELGRRSLSRWLPWAVACALVVGVSVGILRGTADHRTGVVVLPFQNFTGDPTKDFICDGLTEELVDRLAQADPTNLRVIPRTSSMSYKATSKTLEQIGRELQVSYVIEGSLRESQGGLRISQDVIRLPEDAHVDVREFEGTLSELFATEDEMGSSLTALVENRTVGEQLGSQGAAGISAAQSQSQPALPSHP